MSEALGDLPGSVPQGLGFQACATVPGFSVLLGALNTEI